MIKLIEKHPILSIFLFVILTLLPNLEMLNVTIMEARNFITAREMVLDENWLLTTLNGEPRYQKPPLPTWITALFGYASGFKSIFFLRLPSALMIVLIGVFTYLISIKLDLDKLHSLVNAFIVITSFYVIGITIEAPWDIYNHGFMIVGIYFLIRSFNNATNIFDLLLASLFIGLSFLSKGPISFYALLIPFLISYILTYGIPKRNVFKLLLILILALIIGGWWFLYVRFADPNAFIEIAKKETNNWSNYNVRPFYYYWSFVVQSGIWTIPAFVSLLYPYLKKKVINHKAYKLSILWVFISIILLSIIPEKKSRYLMPVLIPLAFNTGFYIEYLIRHFRGFKNHFEQFPVYFNFVLIALVGISFPFIGYFFFKDNLSGYWTHFVVASICLVITGLLILINLKQKSIKNAFYLKLLLFGLILITVIPFSKVLNNNDDYLSLGELKENESAFKIYSYGSLSPELIWDYGDKIIRVINEEQKENKFGLLTKFNSESELKNNFKKYQIDYIMTFDLNPVSKQNKNYKDRLKADYYHLTKK